MHCLQTRGRVAVCALLISISLTACGGGAGGSAPVLSIPAATNGAPVQGPETPLAASAFADSIGINLHMTYVSSPYDTDFALWSPVLIASGIKHVRDAICPYAFAWCQGVESARVNQLAAAGIRTDFLTALNESTSFVQSYATSMGVTAATEAFEGPNECDASNECGAWQSSEGAWQMQLYTLSSSAVTIVGPSMVTQQGYATLGNLAAYLDVGNIHDYAGTQPPESSIGAPAHLAWVVAMSGSKPVWSTEFNYSTDPTFANNGVPQVVQERYLPRLLFEHLRLGIMRTYIYQLFDYGADGGAYMGLLNADYSPKPAWTRILQLLQIFSDTGVSPRVPLSYGVSGDASGVLHHLLFQRSDGTYLLVLWLAQAIYDPASHSVLAPGSESLQLALPANVTHATLVQFGDHGAEQTTALSGAAGAFTVPVTSRISIVEFGIN